jgi:hypothetical protein
MGYLALFSLWKIEKKRKKTYGVHHEVSVVAAVILMFVYVKLPKSQKVPSKFSSSQIYELTIYQPPL